MSNVFTFHQLQKTQPTASGYQHDWWRNELAKAINERNIVAAEVKQANEDYAKLGKAVEASETKYRETVATLANAEYLVKHSSDEITYRVMSNALVGVDEAASERAEAKAELANFFVRLNDLRKELEAYGELIIGIQRHMYGWPQVNPGDPNAQAQAEATRHQWIVSQSVTLGDPE